MMRYSKYRTREGERLPGSKCNDGLQNVIWGEEGKDLRGVTEKETVASGLQVSMQKQAWGVGMGCL